MTEPRPGVTTDGVVIRALDYLVELVQREVEATGGTADLVRVSVPPNMAGGREAARIVAELFDSQGLRVIIEFNAPDLGAEDSEADVSARTYRWIRRQAGGRWEPGEAAADGTWLVPGREDPVEAVEIGPGIPAPPITLQAGDDRGDVHDDSHDQSRRMWCDS